MGNRMCHLNGYTIIDVGDRDDKDESCHTIMAAIVQVQVVTFDGWRRIEQHEAEEGKRRGKHAEKITDIAKLIQVAMAT